MKIVKGHIRPICAPCSKGDHLGCLMPKTCGCRVMTSDHVRASEGVPK